MNRPSFIPLTVTMALTCIAPAVAQDTMGGMLRGSVPLTFIGLDFSQAFFVARQNFPGLDKEGPTYFDRWNELLRTEMEKYNLSEPMKLDHVPTMVEYVRNVNAAVDLNEAWATGNVVFLKEHIPEMVKKYATQDREGVGCVFIVGSFNMTLERSDLYVTFFGMKTHEVLHVEWIEGRPAGLGERNYWAGAVSNVLDEIKKTYRNTWEQRFLKG